MWCKPEVGMSLFVLTLQCRIAGVLHDKHAIDTLVSKLYALQGVKSTQFHKEC